MNAPNPPAAEMSYFMYVPLTLVSIMLALLIPQLMGYTYADAKLGWKYVKRNIFRLPEPETKDELLVDVTHLGEITPETVVNLHEAYTIFKKYHYFVVTLNDEPIIIHGNIYPEFSYGIFVKLQVNGHYYKANGYDTYTRGSHREEFYVSGLRAIKDLDVRPAFESDLEKFRERGKRYLSLTERPSYMYGDGVMIKHTTLKTDSKVHRIQGRVMVDPKGYCDNVGLDTLYGPDTRSGKDIEEHLMNAYLPVYDFENKFWGRMRVSDLSEISFDDTLIHTVHSDHIGSISKLVSNFYTTSYTTVYGKKKGLIFLLNGDPGTGKSMTVEALAESYHIPLLRVGAQNLGNDPKTIEGNLSRVLRMVEQWKGIILIDEADAFLRKRVNDYNDQITSVFLRLLEDYSGIMFLTSNLGNLIDPAIDNRISVRLNYRKADAAYRTMVWESCLRNNNIDARDIKIDVLAEYELNNREIYSVTQLAYIECGGEDINTEVLEKHAKLRLEYSADV